MKDVELYAQVRFAVQIEGLSQRAAARRFGIHPRTVAKMLAFSVPPGYRRRRPPARPKLDPFTGIIDAILAADEARPRKQRHTSKRIFERLRDEHGYSGGITVVKDYVLARRQRHREIFVPLRHDPGHAQVDFGEALAEIAEVKRKILVARSLEGAWEEKLRATETIEQDYERWRRAEPLVLNDADRAALQILGENLPRIWHAATTTPAERKRLLRFIVREVILDQKRVPGQIWLKILWQTGGDQRASCAAARPHLPRLRRSRGATPACDRAQRRRQDGRGNRGGAQSGRLCCGAGRRLHRRERLAPAPALGPCDGEDQRGEREPATLARRHLFGPGRRRGARHHAADRL